MLHLEAENKIIFETLTKIFESGSAPKSGDVKAADFDGTTFVVKAKDKSSLTISITVKCGDVVKKYGLDKVLKDVYGDIVTSPIDNSTATLEIDLSKLDDQKKQLYLTEIPLLKRYVMKAIFQDVFQKQEKKQKWDSVRIPYRDEESIYIVNSEGAVVVLYSIKFSDPTDIVLARTFLKEFQDTRRDRGMSHAPSIRFSVEKKPAELKSFKDSPEPESKEYGFVSFGLFDSHLREQNVNQTIDMLVSFRNYFHYHLKCSKAYMHMRMRDRVQKLLQNLEAAKDKTGIVTHKKTASGKTFNRT